MDAKDLKIKVCGLINQENIDLLDELSLDYIGNIFFAKSPRNITAPVESKVEKVGVFVNEDLGEIIFRIEAFGLSVVQLHGGESNAVCELVKEFGVEVWKVLSIDEEFDLKELNNYPAADLFLLDTKSPKHGGTGKKFDWRILEKINAESPKDFYLSGGIGESDAKEIKELKLNRLIGLDLNSKFEDEPGIKNIDKLKSFLKELRA
jgi:phosphoribosylanthranilate isomerase